MSVLLGLERVFTVPLGDHVGAALQGDVVLDAFVDDNLNKFIAVVDVELVLGFESVAQSFIVVTQIEVEFREQDGCEGFSGLEFLVSVEGDAG